jgi:hypothetical protein
MAYEMGNANRIFKLMKAITNDNYLKVYHVSLFAALCHCWMENEFKECFNISRSRLMKLSKINSLNTYHKVIHELTQGKYISYIPSFHPGKGSRVSILDREI